ncbi:MAG TPA: hypothetical protein VGF27_09380 [Pseudoduganella sp.]|jgi:hypothetical protein
MNHEVQQAAAPQDDKRAGKPRRTERVESRIDLRHKGMKTKVAAGGLLALVGLAAVLFA